MSKPSSPLSLQERRKRLLRRLVGFGLFLLIVGVPLYLLSPLRFLAFNVTASLPGYVYWIERGVVPAKGELVAFYPPINPRYPAQMWFVKVVRGAEGDCVTKRGGEYGAEFELNGEAIAWAKPETSKGEPLRAGPEGCLPAGKFFVWTPHPDSYDSRYAEIGWIDQSRVIGRAHRLL